MSEKKNQQTCGLITGADWLQSAYFNVKQWIRTRLKTDVLGTQTNSLLWNVFKELWQTGLETEASPFLVIQYTFVKPCHVIIPSRFSLPSCSCDLNNKIYINYILSKMTGWIRCYIYRVSFKFRHNTRKIVGATYPIPLPQTITQMSLSRKNCNNEDLQEQSLLNCTLILVLFGGPVTVTVAFPVFYIYICQLRL